MAPTVLRLPPNARGQRPEPAAPGARLVYTPPGCLRFAAPAWLGAFAGITGVRRIPYGRNSGRRPTRSHHSSATLFHLGRRSASFGCRPHNTGYLYGTFVGAMPYISKLAPGRSVSPPNVRSRERPPIEILGDCVVVQPDANSNSGASMVHVTRYGSGFVITRSGRWPSGHGVSRRPMKPIAMLFGRAPTRTAATAKIKAPLRIPTIA
jgi:hypothetical protein